MYLNNILNYCKNIFAYIKDVQHIQSKLHYNQFLLNISKYELLIHKVKYLELIISTIGFKVNYNKVNIIQNKKIPHYSKDI